jgi:hypothetical protein
MQLSYIRMVYERHAKCGVIPITNWKGSEGGFSENET